MLAQPYLRAHRSHREQQMLEWLIAIGRADNVTLETVDRTMPIRSVPKDPTGGVFDQSELTASSNFGRKPDRHRSNLAIAIFISSKAKQRPGHTRGSAPKGLDIRLAVLDGPTVAEALRHRCGSTKCGLANNAPRARYRDASPAAVRCQQVR